MSDDIALKEPAVGSIRWMQNLKAGGVVKLEDGTPVAAAITSRVKEIETHLLKDVTKGEAQLRDAWACHVSPNSDFYKGMARWLEITRERVRVWRERHPDGGGA